MKFFIAAFATAMEATKVAHAPLVEEWVSSWLQISGFIVVYVMVTGLLKKTHALLVAVVEK